MARTELPASVEELQQLVLDQRAELDAKQTRIDEQASLISFLQEWKRLMESQRFGARSERLVPEQGHLFNEAETLAGEGGEEPEAIAVPAHTRNKGGRRPLPDFLPVQEVLHDLSDEEKICPHDPSHTLAEIGHESSEQLNFIPATVEIVRHIRPKYACPHCKEGVSIAPMPG